MVEPLKIESRLETVNNKPRLIIPDNGVSGKDVAGHEYYYREVQINRVTDREVYIAISESGRLAINIIVSHKDFVDGLRMIFPELSGGNNG